MQTHTVCLIWYSVGGGESVDSGALSDTCTAVALKESAASADLKICEGSSGKYLKLIYMIIGHRSF